MTLTNERLDELAAMEQAATAGPWMQDASRTHSIFAADKEFIGGILYNANVEDVAFIAASRNEFAAMVEQCREANRLRKNMTFIREGLAAWLDNAQHNRQRMDKELVVGCLERLIVDAEQAMKGQTE